MPDGTHDEAPPQKVRDWNALAAVIAALIGLLALCVSGYTAWLQRQQVRAQVWPYLEPAVLSSSHDVVMVNKGVGPAIVHRVRLTVDGQPQRNWDMVFKTLGLPDVPPHSTLTGVVVAAGQQIRQLAFDNAEQFDSFMRQYSRLALQICYCSALGECWTFDQRQQDVAQQRNAISSCPGPSAQDFIDNE